MMRRALAPTFLVGSPALESQQRGMKMASVNETLKPIPGHTAGTLNVMNEISVNADADEERKRPVFRSEVYPKRPEHSYLSTMYKWGFNSLSLYKKVNEDPGQWWNANSSTLTSNWAQIGDYAAAGMWSGVWRFTYGQGQYNMTPAQFRQNAFGRKDKATGAVTIDYKETVAGPVESLMAAHLPEHEKHRRYKNPALPGFGSVETVKAKRIEREVQYHLGQGLRMYLIDGYLGSHPSTSTLFRVITDNADHAYAMSLYGIRQSNIHSFREMPLLKRIGVSPMDEWSWRRPGVVVLHAPGYSFEAPRIVEEFGGPRPEDLGLTSPKFRLIDPYSIPMKAAIGADPATDNLVDTIGFLAARWAFYADDKEYVTVVGDSVMNADGTSVTIVLDGTGSLDTNALRTSNFLYGSRHHRLGEGIFSRGWDAVSRNATAATHQHDLVETSLSTVHHPLPTKVNAPKGVDAYSHRLFNKRRAIANFGYKWPHNHTEDKAVKASSAGMLFKPVASTAVGRPSAFHGKSVKYIVVDSKAGAAKNLDGKAAADAVASTLANSKFLYAETEKISAALLKHLSGASVVTVGPSEAKAIIDKLAQSGSQ